MGNLLGFCLFGGMGPAWGHPFMFFLPSSFFLLWQFWDNYLSSCLLWLPFGLPSLPFSCRFGTVASACFHLPLALGDFRFGGLPSFLLGVFYWWSRFTASSFRVLLLWSSRVFGGLVFCLKSRSSFGKLFVESSMLLRVGIKFGSVMLGLRQRTLFVLS